MLLAAFLFALTFLNLQYAPPVAHGKHQLDVFSPAKDSAARTVIIFIHGGGLSEGDRTQFRQFGRVLAAQGYVVIVPSYRLYPEVRVRGAVQDVVRAVAWSSKHAHQFGGTPNKIVLVGHSAGGYLAGILPFDLHYLRSEHLPSKLIRGIFELSADYSNRDPDPGEKTSEIALDREIYGKSAEERDANSVYRYLRHIAVPFEATCESIDPRTQCIDRDHFVALMRGFHNDVRSYTDLGATHEALVTRLATKGTALNRELRRFLAKVTR